MYLDFILVPNNGRFRLKSINIFSTFSTVVRKLSLFKQCLKYRLSNNQNEFLQKDAPSLFGFLPSNLMLNISMSFRNNMYLQGTVIDLQVPTLGFSSNKTCKHFFLYNKLKCQHINSKFQTPFHSCFLYISVATTATTSICF